MRFEPHSDLDLDRRTFLRLAGASGLVFLGGELTPLAAVDQVVDPASIRSMEFTVRYRSEVFDLPRDARDVQLWLPLPSSDYAQTIDDMKIESTVPYRTTHDSLYGSPMIHVASEPRPFSVTASYRVSRRQVGPEAADLQPTELERYLRLTPRVRVTEEVESFARQVIGDATKPYEVAQRLFDGIRDYLVYDKQIPGCGTGDTAWVMRHKRGKCDDYHALYMAIMVSRGIPLRWEQGFPLPLPKPGEAGAGRLAGDCTGAHCWVSFYDADRGWFPVDVSEADKAGDLGGFYFGRVGPNRFKVSEGRHLVLEPAQGADPLPNFAYAYAESDGLPLIYGANYENKIDYVVTRVEAAGEAG